MHTSKIPCFMRFQCGLSSSINRIVRYSSAAVFIGLCQLLVRETEKLLGFNSVSPIYVLEVKARAVVCVGFVFLIMVHILLHICFSSIAFASLT